MPARPPAPAAVPGGRCGRCAFPVERCLCDAIPSLRTPFRFVLLRHASEIPRLTNSGRWAAAALEGSVVLDHALGAPHPSPALEALLGDGPGLLLFPSPHPRPAADVRPCTVVVPDGTWAQARRMVQRIGPLRTLPRLALPAPAGGLRLRRPPGAGGMSTLEAIAAALAVLGEPVAGAALTALHRVAVERALRLKGLWPPERAHHRRPGT